MTKRTTKTAIAVGAGLLLALAVPLSASAHVTVTPYTAEPGEFALITFKVPDESATASTTRVEIDLPSDTPLQYVTYVPVAGWKGELVTTTLEKPITVEGNELKTGVTKVIYTAEPGHGITAGQLQLFQLSVGPVPDVGRLYLPTTQTYSDGTVVKWADRGVDSEHPAPVLYVDDDPEVSDDDDAEVTVATQAEHDSDSSTDVLARVIGIGGLVVGAVGVVVAIVALRRRATD